MPATAYQAGTEANQVVISYGIETVWGTAPATLQAIRATSESMGGQKKRDRPAELNSAGEVSAAVTTQESAGGGVNFALSYATYDDLLAGAVDSSWQSVQAIAGVSGDITLTNGTNILSSTTANKFSTISQGQWIRLLGFTNTANNVIARVIAKTSSTSLTLSSGYVLGVLAPYVTETPGGAAAQVRASTIINSTTFNSFFVQKQFAPALFTNYGGSFVTGCTLSGGAGTFLNGSFTLLSKQEVSNTTTIGTVTAAPTGRVHDPVTGFTGVYLNEAPISGVVSKFSLQIANTGAAMEFGMGSSAAQGVIMGLLTVTGTLDVFFKDFSLYSRFKSEALGTLEFITRDPAGNAYVVTILNSALMNPKIVAGGQNQAVMASFTIEGDPQSTGGTIQIDRLPAT